MRTPRRRPTSARIRLTVAFALVLLAVGAAIVATVVLMTTLVPTYAIHHDGNVDGVQGDVLTDTAKRGDIVTISGPGEVGALLLRTSAIVFGIVSTGGLFACWVLAGRVLRPVERITEAARAAAAGDLGHRIGYAGPDDEFRRLATTFDDMLDRLERAFGAQGRFAANASHELRTPLATMQALLDVALLEPERVDVEDLALRLRRTNTRSIEAVGALLALSDAQSGRLEHIDVKLHEIAREVLASSRAEAAESGVTLFNDIMPTTVTGDPTLLRVLVSNVVQNAIRYNQAGGTVLLRVAPGSIHVENTGKPVGADVLARLPEPFFRGEGRTPGGHGLGLALVDAVATAHGGTLALESRRGGGMLVDVTFD